MTPLPMWLDERILGLVTLTVGLLLLLGLGYALVVRLGREPRNRNRN
jgi:hypothetical protein